VISIFSSSMMKATSVSTRLRIRENGDLLE
jgi:hypothetical protein